jgi:hypothetical protein
MSVCCFGGGSPDVGLPYVRGSRCLLHRVTTELEVVNHFSKKKNWKESVRHFNGGRVRPRDCMLLILAATTLILLSGGSFVEKPGVACKECIELIKLTIAKQNNVKIVLV